MLGLRIARTRGNTEAMSEPQTPAVLYAAKSTQDKHESIPGQLEECREMARDNGWTVVGEYSDEGFSAYSGNRGPDLAAALEAAAKAAADYGTQAMLVAQHSDRFSRGGGDEPDAARALIEIWHAERRRNVHLRSVEDDFDLQSSASVANIGERNRADSERKTKSVAKGMARRAAKGLYTGGRDVFGWAQDGPPGAKRMRPDPVTAPVVQRIFREYIDGHSQQSISRALNAEVRAGQGPPAQYGGEWHQGTLAKILRSPFHVGLLTFRREVIGWGEHADHAIIDVNTFVKAQRRLDRNARTKGHGGGRRPVGGHLFYGDLKLKCGLCHSSMVPRTESRRRTDAGPYSIYHCMGRKTHGLRYCRMDVVRREDVDSAVFAYFTSVALDVDATRAALASRLDSTRREREGQLTAAEQDAGWWEGRIEKVERDYLAGHLEAMAYNRALTTATENTEGARRKVAQLQAAMERDSAAAQAIDVDSELVRRLDAIRAAIAGKVQASRDLEALHEALASLFERFTIYPDVSDADTGWIPEDGGLDSGDGLNDAATTALIEQAGDAEPFIPGGETFWLDPEPRPDAFTGLEVDGRQVTLADDGGPLLRRIPLHTTEANGLTR